MLNDMRYTGTILWRRTKSNIKHFVIVIIGQKCHPCSRFIMFQQVSLRIDIFDIAFHKNRVSL